MVDIILPVLSCAKCGWKWTPRKSSRPAMCPHCGSRRWESTPPDEPSDSSSPKEFKVPRRREGEFLFDWLIRASEAIPAEEAAKLPPDASYNLDHYLYGSPKVE